MKVRRRVNLEDAIGEYLRNGYLAPKSVPDWLVSDLAFEDEGDTRSYTPEGAAAQLDELFDRLCQTFEGPHFVPISGGWDSRIILGALRQRFESKEVVAFTFGEPGQLDYELGAQVARLAGVEHLAVNLRQFPVDWMRLRESVRRCPWTYVPDAAINQYSWSEGVEGVTGTLWSGFLGEALTGGHFVSEPAVAGGRGACAAFGRSQRRARTSRIVPIAHDSLYDVFLVDRQEPFSALEWLDLAVRQRGCIGRIVLPQGYWQGWKANQGRLSPGVHVAAPFAEATWARYWLSAPRELHKNQRLYLEMGQAKMPALFTLPSKSSWGFNAQAKALQQIYRVQHGLRNRAHALLPSLPIRSRLLDNYLDYQRELRRNNEWIEVVEESISVLKAHSATPWLNVDRLWREHYKGKRDHSQALVLLVGLALNLDVNTAGERVLNVVE